jgi:hypothetical protein
MRVVNDHGDYGRDNGDNDMAVPRQNHQRI